VTKQTMSIFESVYEHGDRFNVDRLLSSDPLVHVASGVRPNSIAVAGGAFGDEGKGRIVDALCARLTQQHGSVIVYRWNGGANAGHTVVVGETKIALHQLPSGALTPNATVILGKGMVLHPGDLIEEIERVQRATTAWSGVTLMIDPLAVLSLDTHRAFEGALKTWESGGKGSTGRGISPAYADVLFRHPMRVRDLFAPDWRERLSKHYDLYTAWTRGLGYDLAGAEVRSLTAARHVGTRDAFLDRLAEWRDSLAPYTQTDVIGFVREQWRTSPTPFVFEGAQGIGLDPRFGVYPDITASDPTFDGIRHSTEGVINPQHVAVRAGAIKATYTSSVGTRCLPTMMPPELAHRIREDAHEYGATTRRPRDIAYIDVPCLQFFAEVSGMTHLILTHMDIAYADTPIRVCTQYANGAYYRPDQDYLNTVTPQYIDLPAWDGKAVQGVNQLEALPPMAIAYIAFLTRSLGVAPIFATTGAEREAILTWLP
jgi:adenylosuccinate synthase